ncbi:MAG: DEAD/DEAH box helicase family protein, partial [Clostridia bacterium]|nr:DEAD/DEAH box helicase family protein [Deltaproteobacteria bacterium]
ARAIELDPVRMLLADEVGLGKTVEAALIYAGLRQEGRARRVIILTPESLTIQWLGEIYRKAHELLVLLDDERINDAAVDMPELGPFEAYQRVVVSIDRIAKDPDLAEQCVSSQWDLVIVDEAHHLKWGAEKGGTANKSGANATYRLVELLAKQTRHLLLLTATPMALDPAEYHALLRLLDPTRFDDPSAFEAIAQRASIIRDVGRHVGAALDGTPLPKTFNSDATKVLEDDPDDLQLLERLVKAKPTAKDYKQTASRVLEALLQRHGLAEYVVRNRRGPVGGLPQRKAQTIALEPSERQDALIEVGESVMFDLVGSMTGTDRNAMLGRLLRALWATPRALADILMPISPALLKELAPLIEKVIKAPLDAEGLPTGDMRLRWLLQQVRALDPGDKLLVFVETQVAVQALRDALEPFLAQNIAVFHRGLAARDQDRQVAWFRDSSGPQIMLSTEAGGEGRNFQFCNKVVLYDLPWRPATIEQRIGRIDRVGQSRDVHVLVPYFKAGYEAAILKVMQESIGVLDKTVGGIDHQLEYVSDRLAELVLTSATGKGSTAKGSTVELWKALYRETDKLVGDARARVENDVDVILDHASFSPERARAILSAVPPNLEERLEEFVQRFADHTKVALKSRGNGLFAVEGTPGATGRTDD